MRLTDNSKLVRYIEETQLASLALPIDETGTIHIAAMRCMATINPFRIYFVTGKESEKCGLLRTGRHAKAACEIGAHEDPDIYLQMRGTVQMFEFSNLPQVVEAYFAHRGEPNRMKEGSTSVLLEFTPTYAKYTDYAEGWEKHTLELI